MASAPGLRAELDDRQAQRQKLAALFRASPFVDIEPDELRTITPHYQQRISELRAKDGLTIENVLRTALDGSGKAIRRDGAYRYRSTGPALGRAADTLMEAEWPTAHGRPFEEPFSLKP